ncbi:MAG: SDR family oxidoreductase [Clostridia bacterium]|nr:SDR family oxidoreductase [Clostridia bacterium]
MQRVTLISGASGGIGNACALALGLRGDCVAVHYHKNKAAADAVVLKLLKAGKCARAYQADLTKEAEVFQMHNSISTELGPVNILVNNAGASESALFQDITESMWDNMLNTNLKSAYMLSRAVLPAMISKKNGCILNIASMWGQVGSSCEVHYSAAKGGLIAMTKALAKELGPSGIRVNCIAPGAIQTDMLRHLTEAELKTLEEETPLGRLGDAEDIANAVLFLTDTASSFITGQILGVNGGIVI